ncbi:hypothetical protein P7H26_04960 [Enterococcus asini]|nr:hypothetical protein [Enterococcus asini]
MKPVLSEFDYQVLSLIPRGERRIVSREIQSILHASERLVRDSIERLRKNGVPIVADRVTKNKGMYIATTPEEKNVGLVSLQNQVKTTQKTIADVRQSKLNTWDYDLQDPEWREKATGEQVVEIDGKEFSFHAELAGGDTRKGYVTIPEETMNAIKNTLAQKHQGNKSNGN